MSQSAAQPLLDAALQHHGAGELPQAESLYRQVLALEPDNYNAMHLLGVLYYQNGILNEAEKLISRAVETAPDFAEAHSNLGLVYQAQRQWEKAANAYEQALMLKPEFTLARFNQGNLRRDQGRLNDAATCYRQALQIKPNYAEALFNLGDVLFDLERLEEAIEAYEQGLNLNPTHQHAQYNLGLALDALGRLEEGADFYRRALEADPSIPEAHVNLANILNVQGRFDEAIASYRRALDLKPGLSQAHSNLLFCLHYQPGLDPAALYAEHREFNQHHAKPLAREIQPHTNSRNPERRLRIGYVSADFKQHSVAYFLEPVLAARDREHFSVYCYSGVAKPDAVTARLQAQADVWRNTVGMQDQTLTQMIRADEIDILVDLSGHTSGNRLPVFATKPAPIQITWLGYPDTTGLDTIDYRFTDALTDPPGAADQLHSEKLVRLAQGFLCFQPAPDSPPVGDLPATSAHRVTFASFNNLPKITPEVVAVWARILQKIPAAHLLLKSKPLGTPAIRDRYLGLFAEHGIGPERLTLAGKIPEVAGHLALYNQVDIALDPFPYNGTTTTCEALWMGVPVVTLAGDHHCARVGANLLARIGLEELVAESADAYVQKAVAMAQDLPRLAQLRAELRGRMQHSPLCDAMGFTRTLEAAYRDMWRNWCATKPSQPAALRVNIADGITLHVPASLALMTPYVLLEQEDWLEDEISFVRNLLKPGMNVIDIGASYGVYTTTMAKRIGPQGRLWAIEPARATMELLQQSVETNHLDNIQLIQAALSDHDGSATLNHSANSELNALASEVGATGETIVLRTLDSCAGDLGWRDIDFIKLDVEGAEANVVTGGMAFLQRESPLIMYEVKHENRINLDLIAHFSRLGYASYRLVPGLALLAPFDTDNLVDPYLLNLFCCKPDRADALARAGLLVRDLDPPCPEPLDESMWFSHLTRMPYAKPFSAVWLETAEHSDSADWQRYRNVLNLYAQAHTPALAPTQRFSSLQQCVLQAIELARNNGSFARLATLARVAAEFGARELAVEALQTIEAQPQGASPWALNEPFLPVCARFDSIDPGPDTQYWIRASVLEQLEKLRGYSSYFNGESSLPALQWLNESGFQSAQMERRRQLVRLRSGQQAVPEPSVLLATASGDNLNPDFWSGGGLL